MFSKNIQNVGLILSLVLISSVTGNSFGSYQTAWAEDAFDRCPEAMTIYKDVISNINSGTESRFGNKVSEDVANFVSTPPISDKVGEVNKAASYLTTNCHTTESGIKLFADYNQNIYDSLEIYKNTTPHAIPEFGELSMIMIGLSFVGIIAITKRHEIVSALKKLVRF